MLKLDGNWHKEVPIIPKLRKGEREKGGSLF